MTQSFDEWYKEKYFTLSADIDEAKEIYEAGAQSRQAEIDALREMVKKLIDNTVLSIDDELEDQANNLLRGSKDD